MAPFVNHDVEVDMRKPRDAFKQIDKTAKMEGELRSFGKPVSGGYMMTNQDLARFFASKEKKRKRRS